MITVDDLKQSLPVHMKTAATQSLADKVNQITTDPEAASVIRDSFITYTQVLSEGRFTTDDYLNAVAYVSFKIMGHTNQDAYKRVFPNRYSAMVARGATEKDISAYVAAYNKNKMVNMIFERSMISPWVLNQDVYQKAINTQVDLMMTANSEKVRSDAANSILTHLKKPEMKHEHQIDVNLKESSGMTELKDMLTSLAQHQKELIGQGVTTREIAHQKLGQTINGKAKDVTPKSS